MISTTMRDAIGTALWSHRWWLAMMLTIAAAAGAAAQPADRRNAPGPSRSVGVLALGRDGQLLIASAARIKHEAGVLDKVGSFVLGLGSAAPGYDSAAVWLRRLTPRGAPDPGFGNGGSVVTPLLPLRNRDRATVTALVTDAAGRATVVGWRTLSSGLDANVPVMVVARYSAAGGLDASFGDRGVVTTRLEQAGVTQAYGALLDPEGRLLVAGYHGGMKRRNTRGSFDDWPVRVILMRYTASGILDPSFGVSGVASLEIVSGGPDGRQGREFLLYDYGRTKAVGLTLDRQGRSVIAAASDEGPIVLMRFTREGSLDAGFGSAGVVRTPIGTRSGISALVWDVEGRLLAVGTSDNHRVVVRYSADGRLDATYGDGGIHRTSIGEGMRVSAAVTDADGHVHVVASGNTNVELARYDRAGRPDPTFGSTGVQRTALDNPVTAPAGLAIDEQGMPIVAAVGGRGLVLLRYGRAGQVDKSVLPVPGQ